MVIRFGFEKFMCGIKKIAEGEGKLENLSYSTVIWLKPT
jgi:hypothetical protein